MHPRSLKSNFFDPQTADDILRVDDFFHTLALWNDYLEKDVHYFKDQDIESPDLDQKKKNKVQEIGGPKL